MEAEQKKYIGIFKCRPIESCSTAHLSNGFHYHQKTNGTEPTTFQVNIPINTIIYTYTWKCILFTGRFPLILRRSLNTYKTTSSPLINSPSSKISSLPSIHPTIQYVRTRRSLLRKTLVSRSILRIKEKEPRTNTKKIKNRNKKGIKQYRSACKNQVEEKEILLTRFVPSLLACISIPLVVPFSRIKKKGIDLHNLYTLCICSPSVFFCSPKNK